MNDFSRISELLNKNIAELKSTMKKSDWVETFDRTAFERVVYIFHSTTKSLIDVGNSIIIENDFRKPLNTADVFISLAEHNIISSLIVPNLKKAAFMIVRMKTHDDAGIVKTITDCVNDFNRCLVSFSKYYGSKSPGT
jgi:uncharacterized protein YutE (UPF0331/DUF86 family)